MIISSTEIETSPMLTEVYKDRTNSMRTFFTKFNRYVYVEFDDENGKQPRIHDSAKTVNFWP